MKLVSEGLVTSLLVDFVEEVHKAAEVVESGGEDEGKKRPELGEVVLWR